MGVTILSDERIGTILGGVARLDRLLTLVQVTGCYPG
jgi:hypothetical protein